MSDYAIKVTVKNNRLLSAISGAGYSVASFSRACGVPYIAVLDLICMRTAATSRRKQGLDSPLVERWRAIVIQISDFLNVSPHDLFTPRQAAASDRLSSNYVIDETSLLTLQEAGTTDGGLDEITNRIDRERFLASALERLSKREIGVIIDRFGLLGDSKKHEQVGKRIGVSGNRAMQIEAKALSKMRAHLRRGGITSMAALH